MLSIAATHAAQCFLRKKLNSVQTTVLYRSTIKMHESSPVAAALFFYSISLRPPAVVDAPHQQPTHQPPVYQLHIIPCGTIIVSEF